MKGRKKIIYGSIKFKKLFDRSIRRKAEKFLESGTPAATLTKGILIAAALGGVLAVSVVAPNLFRAFRLDSKEYGKRLNKEGFKKVRRSCYQLKRRGLVEIFSNEAGEASLYITQKGTEILKRIIGMTPRERREKKNHIFIPLPSHWDGKWRFILFDIPIDFNTARDALRRELRLLGCYQIQQSVFVHPFPCAKEIIEVVCNLNIKRFVEVCTVEDFSNKHATEFFGSLLHNHK